MVVRDYLSWILDRPNMEVYEAKQKLHGDEYRKWYSAYSEENYRRNIEFVHSLGLKCDPVGWCLLELDRPDAGEILDKIDAFCRENGWEARGGCTRLAEDFESDWYEIYLRKETASAEIETVLLDNGEKIFVPGCAAYKNKGAHILEGWNSPPVVSEKFRDVCLRHQIPGIRFCWSKDVGRYASGQYFLLYADTSLPYVAGDGHLRYSDQLHWTATGLDYSRDNHILHGKGSPLYTCLEKLGGYLPRLAEIFANLKYSLPTYYPASELPEEGFAHLLYRVNGYQRDVFLVHRKTAEILMEEKVLRREQLFPVLLYDEEVPAGYTESEMKPMLRPSDEYIEEKFREYESFRLKERPRHVSTEKQALTELRRAKRDRKEDFVKPLKKEIAETLIGTAYEPMIPFYRISDGGSISDEYTLYPYAESLTETAVFHAAMEKEELLDEKPQGIVIAGCADGDKVLLKPDGTVYRMSHEVPEIYEDWQTLPQFIADTLEEAE